MALYCCLCGTSHNVKYDSTASHFKAPCFEGQQEIIGDPRDRLGATCSATLASKNSNFTDCPPKLADRRLIVRGQCGQDTFQVWYQRLKRCIFRIFFKAGPYHRIIFNLRHFIRQYAVNRKRLTGSRMERHRSDLIGPLACHGLMRY